MSEYLKILLIVCPLVFLAAFMDAIAGGGGIISVPAYLLAGLPVHVAYGCNKFVATISQIFAVARYGKSGHIRLRPALVASASSLLGGYIGSRIVLLISEDVLKISLMIVLPIVAIFLVTRKNFTGEAPVEKTLTPAQTVLYPLLIGLGCGFYDGCFGPGTGTFLILAFTAVMGYDLMTSGGCAKVINLASGVGSMTAYLFAGKVYFAVAIPAAIAASIGSHIGSGAAVKNGAKLIRPVIFVVLGLLFAKIIYDFFIAK